MVDSVSNSGFRPPPPPPANTDTASLSDDQTALIQDTLSQFDASNLSAEDANSIVESFSQAGIAPSAEFASVLEEAGFDAREIGDLANVGGTAQAPASSAQSQGLSLASVTDFLDNLSDTQDNTSSNSLTLAEQVAQQFGLSEDQQLISVTA